MSPESPQNRTEISELEWHQLKEECQHYYDLITSQIEQASASWSHIVLNLSTYIFEITERSPKSEEQKQKWYQYAAEELIDLKRYFKLLDDFPEFAEKELTRGKGYYPELMSQIDGEVAFIDEYERRLRGTQLIKTDHQESAQG